MRTGSELWSDQVARLRIELSTGFQQNYPYDEWFLAGQRMRSASLEVAATEFQVQGLELDWVGLCWGNDLAIGDTESGYFSGSLEQMEACTR